MFRIRKSGVIFALISYILFIIEIFEISLLTKNHYYFQNSDLALEKLMMILV